MYITNGTTKRRLNWKEIRIRNQFFVVVYASYILCDRNLLLGFFVVNLPDLLFFFFSSLAAGGGLLMVVSKHPVPAALFMILSLVGVASLFVLLEAFFLAILQILVYAGAVMVLFLFIIMLLDVGPDGGKASKIRILSGFAGAVAVGLIIVCLLYTSPSPRDV